MALRARATIGILKEMGCSLLARLQAHSNPDDADNENVAHQDRMTPVESVYKVYKRFNIWPSLTAHCRFF